MMSNNLLAFEGLYLFYFVILSFIYFIFLLLCLCEYRITILNQSKEVVRVRGTTKYLPNRNLELCWPVDIGHTNESGIECKAVVLDGTQSKKSWLEMF